VILDERAIRSRLPVIAVVAPKSTRLVAFTSVVRQSPPMMG
jgi:hypothetical protein